MSTRSLGSLTLDLIAKVGGFVSGMDQASRVAQDRMRKIGATVAKASAAIGVSWGAMGAAAIAMTKGFVDSATQIENLSQLAGSSTQEFQRWAAGAATVGISQEKLADILKDTQDKVGDFIQTGGGGMADFFERVAPKVGVTAEQFRKLSGPQALQLYVSSLEKANLAQSDFKFFMEAIASDSSALLPLLMNNGKAMKDLGDNAADLGAIMDEQMLSAAKRAREEFQELDLVKKGLVNRITAELLPTVSSLSGKLNDVAKNTTALDTAARQAATGMKLLSSVGVIVGGVFQTLGVAIGGMAAQTVAILSGDFDKAAGIVEQVVLDMKGNVESTVKALDVLWDDRPPIIFLDPPEAEKTEEELDRGFVKPLKKARDEVGTIMASIRRELETFGMTDIELKLFDLKGKGASDEILKEAEAILKRVDALKKEKQQREEVEEARKREVEEMLDWKKAIEDTLADYEFEYELLKMTNDEREIAIALRYANAEAASEEGKMIVEAIRRNQEFAKEQEQMIQGMDAIRGAGADFLVDFTSGAKSFKDSMMDALDSIHRRILQMIAEKLMDQLFGQQGTTGGGSGWGQAIGNIFSSMFGGGRAGGGSVQPYSMYRVNEVGMEMLSAGGRDYLLTGSQGGTITPHNRMRGGINQSINVTIAGRPDNRTPEQIARAVGRESQRGMARTGG